MTKPKKAQKSRAKAKTKKSKRLSREPKVIKKKKKAARKSQSKSPRVKKSRVKKAQLTKPAKAPRSKKPRGKKAPTKKPAFRGIPFAAPIPPQPAPPPGGGSVWWSQIQGVITQKAIEADRRAREERLAALSAAAKRRAQEQEEAPSGHAVWQGNPSSTERELLTIFSRITYRGGPVEDMRIDRDRNGTLRLYAWATVGRRRVQVQGYEVVVRDGRSVRSTIFWGQLDKTTASDPRLAFEEGLYPNQGPVDPNVDFVTAWAAA